MAKRLLLTVLIVTISAVALSDEPSATVKQAKTVTFMQTQWGGKGVTKYYLDHDCLPLTFGRIRPIRFAANRCKL